jgi:hypothetical protein
VFQSNAEAGGIDVCLHMHTSGLHAHAYALEVLTRLDRAAERIAHCGRQLSSVDVLESTNAPYIALLIEFLYLKWRMLGCSNSSLSL